MGTCCSQCKGTMDVFKSQDRSKAVSLGPEFLESCKNEIINPNDVNVNVYYIQLHSVNKIADALNISGLGGPYVQLKLNQPDDICGDQLQRSCCKPFDKLVKWEPSERFQFVVTSSTPPKILISVYSFNPVRSPEAIGDCLLNLGKYVRGEPSTPEKLTAISPTDGHKTGEINIEIECVSFTDAINHQISTVFEYQRWQVTAGWGSTYPGHFLPSDPGRWSCHNLKKYGDKIEDVILPLKEGWLVLQDWQTMATDSDPDGWEYAVNFNVMVWRPTPEAQHMVVRRRQWQRKVTAPGMTEKSTVKTTQTSNLVTEVVVAAAIPTESKSFEPLEIESEESKGSENTTNPIAHSSAN